MRKVCIALFYIFTIFGYFIESYISVNYGNYLDEEQKLQLAEQLRPSAKSWAQGYAKERMLVKAIADAAGISTTEMQLATYADKKARLYGLGSGDVLIAYYGKDTVWYDYVYEMVLEYIIKTVVFE